MPPKPFTPRRKRRQTPYFKIQVFNEGLQCWRDQRPVFDTLEEAREHIARRLAPKRARVMRVERERRYPLPEDGE